MMIIENPGVYFPPNTFVSFVDVDSVFLHSIRIYLSNNIIQTIPEGTNFTFGWKNTIRTGIDNFERFEINTNVTPTNTLYSDYINNNSIRGSGQYGGVERRYIKNIEFSTFTGNPDVDAGEFIFNVGKITKNYPFKTNTTVDYPEEELNNKILSIKDNGLKLVNGFVYLLL